ncbi:MAG: GYD domain-containing protein, partial [Desulfobacterales bacterium]
MAVYFMFGKYTSAAIKEISASRTQQAVEAIKNLGGEVTAMHILMGEYDLLFCVKLPGNEEAIRASVEL